MKLIDLIHSLMELHDENGVDYDSEVSVYRAGDSEPEEFEIAELYENEGHAEISIMAVNGGSL